MAKRSAVLRSDGCIVDAAALICMPRWTVVSGHTHDPDATRKIENFDFVVVCSGMYNWPPNMPVAQDADKFRRGGGSIMHSCEFSDKKMVRCKKACMHTCAPCLVAVPGVSPLVTLDSLLQGIVRGIPM